GEHEQEAIGDDEPAREQQEKCDDLEGGDPPVHLVEREAHHGDAHQKARYRPPINISKRNQKLLVNRLQKIKVEIARTNQVGELVAVDQEQRLDQARQSKIAAEKEQVFRFRPVGDHRRLGKDNAIEGQKDSQPNNFHGDLHEEVHSKGNL